MGKGGTDRHSGEPAPRSKDGRPFLSVRKSWQIICEDRFGYIASEVSRRCGPCFEVFPVETFLNLRPDFQKELRQSTKSMKDVFDSIGSEKFKVPSLSVHLAGMLRYDNSKILRLHFLVKYDLLSGI